MLGVTEKYGDRLRFHEKIAKIKKDWNEKKEKEYKESKKVSTEGIKNMLTKLATTDLKSVQGAEAY